MKSGIGLTCMQWVTIIILYELQFKLKIKAWYDHVKKSLASVMRDILIYLLFNQYVTLGGC